MVQIFNLEDAQTYSAASPVIEVVTGKLTNVVQLDGLEVLSWSTDRITYHGVTRKTSRSVLITVERDGSIYARYVDGSETALKIGELSM